MGVESTRGYTIVETWAYINERMGADFAAQVADKTGVDYAAAVLTIKATGWYPVDQLVSLWDAVVDAADSDEEAFKRMVEIGEFMATRASSTFLRLLLRVITPNMFARKIPDFWAHDFKGGAWGLDNIGEGRCTSTITDIAGINNVGPAACGWVGFVFKTMGKKDVVVTAPAWSRDNRGPEQISVEMRWR